MRIAPIIVAALLAAACRAQQAPQNEAANAAAPDASVENEAPPAGHDGTPPPSIPAVPAPGPAPEPPAPPPPPSDPNAIPASDKTPAAAKRLLDDYFAALATKHYGRAYRMWNGDGQATGMTQAEFAASFAKYKIYDGRAFEPGDSEGAAGSIYIEFPVTVTGILARGGGFSLSGPMTLKRVNDVDGSTAQQRHWHIQSSGLKPRP